MIVRNISKFTCSVYRFVSPLVAETLKRCSIDEYFLQPAKALVSVDRRRFLLSGGGYMENIMDTYHFSCETEREVYVFEQIVKDLSLDQEGRGSIYVEPAVIIDHNDNTESSLNFTDLDVGSFDTKLMGIYCIIQRGRGDIIAKTAIDTGSSVPAIYYGVGGGIRDRMGLIRITIPADKEMANIIVTEHDCIGMMNILIDAGSLDRPGMGFIFNYPVTRAVTDTRTYIGKSRSAASIGQIVKAIDGIKGNTEWRKRIINPLNIKERNFLKDLDNITLICDDTKAKDMLDVAMCAGATGATLSKCRRSFLSKENGMLNKKSVEMADMVVSTNQKSEIIQALINAGFFSSEINGKIMIRKSTLAFSYSDNGKS
ncbi:MAG TPA: hypothetical protein PL056_12805 [bacterium]|nr:hypothetical protein [bacterium]